MIDDKKAFLVVSAFVIASVGMKLIKGREVISSVSFNSCKPKENVGQIRFDCKLEEDRYEMIADDLAFLKSLNFTGENSKKLRSLLKLKDSSGSELFDWLEKRIDYIVNEDFDVLRFDNEYYGMHYSLYQYDKAVGSKRLTPVLLIPGHEATEVHVGESRVIKLNSSFYGIGTDRKGKLERARSFIRLSVLFHEARHGDKYRLIKYYDHVHCPPGRGSEYKTSCDPNSEGPYGVEALFLRTVLDNCVDCSSEEANFMEGFLADAEDRILG